MVDPSGRIWRVELVEDSKDVYFIDEWRAFVDDNKVQDGIFYFFKLHRSLMFSVTIYDESMCEKVILVADLCSEQTDD